MVMIMSLVDLRSADAFIVLHSDCFFGRRGAVLHDGLWPSVSDRSVLTPRQLHQSVMIRSIDLSTHVVPA